MRLERHKEAFNYLKKQGIKEPYIGIVLGTGLGRLAKQIEIEISIPYSEIPHFPLATVEFHKGQLIYGKLGGKQVLAMQGRFHLYEGYSAKEIAFPVQVMNLLGISYLFLSNAAGGLNPLFEKGDIMLITDHINLLPDSPLRGRYADEQGPRFPDMSKPYDSKINDLFRLVASVKGISLREGTYAAVPGPNLETRAEYRLLRNMGADAVGMSTVPEVIAAAQMNLPCCAVSVITDLCDPDFLQPVKIEEIIEAAGIGEEHLAGLLPRIIASL